MLLLLQLCTFGKSSHVTNLIEQISAFSSFIILPLDFDNDYDSSKPVKKFKFGHALDKMITEDPDFIKSLQFGVYRRAV